MNNQKLRDWLAFTPRDPGVRSAKRALYIFLFACLGLMVAYFLYVLSTVATIFLLLLDFPRYGLGLTWKIWTIVGKVWFEIMLVAGCWVGVSLGKYFWRVIYIEKRLKKVNKK